LIYFKGEGSEAKLLLKALGVEKCKSEKKSAQIYTLAINIFERGGHKGAFK